ncbi:MAG: DUF1573 domain-containing protein [Ignavibacteria bacterium]|nr:DUF1573 domain-containing protein [Ignavibacteria bacterium]
MKKYLLLIILGTIIISCIKNKRHKESNEEVKLLPELRFFQKVSDFGSVPKDTILMARYYFMNSGNDTLYIENISPDCTCTSYHLSKNNILPNDTAFIELEFNTEHKYGEEKVYAVVEANTISKMYKLTIKANVY